jgi:hypothetical protein
MQVLARHIVIAVALAPYGPQPASPLRHAHEARRCADDDQPYQVVLHEDKKYYPSAGEVYGDAEVGPPSPDGLGGRGTVPLVA